MSPNETKPTNPKDGLGVTKLPLHLVSPIVKAYQSIAQYLGAVKYGAWNFRAGGARASVYRAALERHMDAWWEGEELDPVDGTPHLANALACIGILIDTKHAGLLVDDRPPSQAQALGEVRKQFETLMEAIRVRYSDRPEPKHYTAWDMEPKDRPPARREPKVVIDESWSEWPCSPPRDYPALGEHGAQVEVLLRDGTVRVGQASLFRWIQHGGSNDIVAYRKIKHTAG